MTVCDAGNYHEVYGWGEVVRTPRSFGYSQPDTKAVGRPFRTGVFGKQISTILE